MYVFREIETTDDLERYCRMRSSLYSPTRLAPFLENGDAGIDLDRFDLHARHYGIYHGADLVGGVRVIVEPQSLFNTMAFELGTRGGVFDGTSRRAR